MELLHGDICSNILKGFYSIANALPFGLDKSFYVNALAIELRQSGLQIEVNKEHAVFYKENEIGKLTVDIVINNLVLITVDNQQGFIEPEQIELSKNYLRLTHFEVLLLLNFGLEADHKRLLMTNNFKNG